MSTLNSQSSETNEGETGDDDPSLGSLIKIDNILNHPEFIPIIVKWTFEEWYTSYLDFKLDNLEKAIDEFKKNIQYDRLPICYVAYIDNIPVGTIGMDYKDTPQSLDHLDKNIPWVIDVFVNKDFRKKGIATFLIKYIIKKAKEMGFKSLYLWTTNQQNIYKKFGWVEIEKITYLDELYSLMLLEF